MLLKMNSNRKWQEEDNYQRDMELLMSYKINSTSYTIKNNKINITKVTANKNIKWDEYNF